MIGALPDSERPRERCLLRGADCLSLRECLAVVLGTGPPHIGCLGLARGIIELPGAGLSESDAARALFTTLEVSGMAALEEVDGLGAAGKARILASFELARRYAVFREERGREEKRRDEKKCAPSASNSPAPALSAREHALLRASPERRIDSREWLGFVPFYRPGDLGGLCIVERGVRTHVNVDPMELFARVLATRAKGFFLFHNHPSGDLRPSVSDREITDRVAQVARALGTCLLGHWIVAAGGEVFIEP